MRAALEGLAGELFARRAGDAEIEELAAIARDMAKEARRPKGEGVLATKDRFYATLFAGADNDTLAELIAMLNSRVALLRRLSLASPKRGKTMMAEVDQIIAAARARDPAAMRAACTAHVQSAAETILPALAQADPQVKQSSEEDSGKG